MQNKIENALTHGAPPIGQTKIAATGVSQQLATVGNLTNGVILTAKSTNTASIVIGNSSAVTNTTDGTGNGAILEPGASLSYACDSLNRVWLNGTSNDILSYSGS